jgi:hypothetical protein
MVSKNCVQMQLVPLHRGGGEAEVLELRVRVEEHAADAPGPRG